MREALAIFTLLAACALSSESRADERLPNRPNVVFILADDVGWNDVGAYSSVASPGHDISPVIKTPNIDRLAREGMLFTDAHTPKSLCAPNRFSLLTGSNPYRNGRPGGSWGLLASSGFGAGLERTGKVGKHLTVGDVMKAAGYRTGFVGKTHLGATAYAKDGRGLHAVKGGSKHKHELFASMDYSRGIDDGVCEHGFDYALTLEDGIQGPPYAYFENGVFKPIDGRMPADNSSTKDWKRKKPHQVGNNGVSEFAHGPFIGDVNYDSSQVGIRLAREAVAFIDRCRQAEQSKPFFLYYCSQSVHWPHTPPIDFDGDPATVDEPVKGVTPGPTSDMIYELDLQVGAILAKLEAEGILRNTLVIFTSDNGGLAPKVVRTGDHQHDTTGILRGHKATNYEGGHRVPFIARWGGRIPAGTVNTQLIAAHDWVATLYDLTDQDMSDGQAMDSVSLLPVLLGRKPIDTRIRGFLSFGFAGIREGSFFLLCNQKRPYGPTEFYDLAQDLAQETNLIADPAHASRIKAMHARMLKHNNCDARDLSEPRSTPAHRETRPHTTGG